MSGELASERWSPAQRVESVLISILSLLDDAEVSSPANVDAGKMLRTDPEKFRSIVKSNVEASKKDIPAGFEMPVASQGQSAEDPEKEDPDFWAESGEDGDPFGGSDSDEEMQLDHTGSEEDEDDDDEEEFDEGMEDDNWDADV